LVVFVAKLTGLTPFYKPWLSNLPLGASRASRKTSSGDAIARDVGPINASSRVPICRYFFRLSRRSLPFVLICGLVVASTTGCILGSSKAGAVIDKVVPKPNQRLACTNTGIDGPNGRVCSWIVKGSEVGVVKGIAASLGRGIEVIGSRPGMRVSADVIPSGFAVLTDNEAIFFGPGTQVPGKTVQIPSDSVGLKIDASEYASTDLAGDSCSAIAG
jgi:hypothetical protein